MVKLLSEENWLIWDIIVALQCRYYMGKNDRRGIGGYSLANYGYRKINGTVKI